MRMGYLDARALHPDVHACTLNEFAKEFYAMPEPGYMFSLAGWCGVGRKWRGISI